MSLDDPALTHPVVHAVAASTTVVTVFGLLPGIIGALAALAAFIWYCIQIVESASFRKGTRRFRKWRNRAVRKVNSPGEPDDFCG